MQTEYEATFTHIDKDTVRQLLQKTGAVLVRPEFMQKRVTFNLPPGQNNNTHWVRVRDEGDRVTMSLKTVAGDKITDQKEICLTVNNYDDAAELLKNIGCRQKSFQESRRELWRLDKAEVTIDEWPFLEPFVEIEGKSELEVKQTVNKLGFDWNKAKFCSITTLYKEKYGVSDEQVNNQTPRIVFGENNPFIKQ